jgi:hypothetical protein
VYLTILAVLLALPPLAPPKQQAAAATLEGPAGTYSVVLQSAGNPGLGLAIPFVGPPGVYTVTAPGPATILQTETSVTITWAPAPPPTPPPTPPPPRG